MKIAHRWDLRGSFLKLVERHVLDLAHSSAAESKDKDKDKGEGESALDEVLHGDEHIRQYLFDENLVKEICTYLDIEIEDDGSEPNNLSDSDDSDDDDI